MILYGPFTLPHGSILVYPEGVDPKGNFGKIVFYDKSETSLREATNNILKENNMHIFDHRYHDNDDISCHVFLGDREVNPKSLLPAYGLPMMTPRAHSQTEFSTLEDMADNSFLGIFNARCGSNLSEFIQGYCAEFILNCLTEEALDEFNFFLRFTERILEKAPDETKALFEVRKSSYEKYRLIWMLEKEMVLNEKKSFLISRQFSRVLNEFFSSSDDVLLEKLKLISEDFNIHETIKSIYLTGCFSNPKISEDDVDRFRYFIWNVSFSCQDFKRDLDCFVSYYENNDHFLEFDEHYRGYNPEKLKEKFVDLSKRFAFTY